MARISSFLLCAAAVLAAAPLFSEARAQDDTPPVTRSKKKKGKKKQSGQAWLVGKPAGKAELKELDSEPYSRGIDVFVAGEGNPYASIRIPDIINAGGILVAMAEGRYQNTDQGQNDLIVSVSKDGGRKWSKP
ncbi:MAG: exo-alpha-sialidase, partial [Akkermansia sp.]|nr:exo-alpha-sialidase [Akkermansia sp.]